MERVHATPAQGPRVAAPWLPPGLGLAGAGFPVATRARSPGAAPRPAYLMGIGIRGSNPLRQMGPIGSRGVSPGTNRHRLRCKRRLPQRVCPRPLERPEKPASLGGPPGLLAGNRARGRRWAGAAASNQPGEAWALSGGRGRAAGGLLSGDAWGHLRTGKRPCSKGP